MFSKLRFAELKCARPLWPAMRRGSLKMLKPSDLLAVTVLLLLLTNSWGTLTPPNFVWSGLARSRRRTPPVLAAARILVSKYQAASSFFWTCCFCCSLLSQWIRYPRKLCTCMDGDQVKFRPWPRTACSSGHAPAGGLGLEVLHTKLKAVLWCHAATPGWKICQTLFFPACWVYLMFFRFQMQIVSKTSGLRALKRNTHIWRILSNK